MKGAEIMTNEQYYGIIRMIGKIVKKCETKEEIMREIKSLLKKDPPEDDEI